MAESAPLERIFYVNYWYEFNNRHWPQDFVTYTDKILQLYKNKYHQKLVLFNLNNECNEKAFNLGHTVWLILYVGESSRDRFWGLILRKNWLWDLVCWKEIYSEIYSFNILVGIKTTFHRFLHRVKTILIYYSKNMIETVAHTTIDDQPPSYEDAVNNNSR